MATLSLARNSQVHIATVLMSDLMLDLNLVGSPMTSPRFFSGLQPDLPAHALERSTVRLGLTDKSAIAQYTVWRGQASVGDGTQCMWTPVSLVM